MRFLLGWMFKLAFAGVLYVTFVGGHKVQLPDTVMGHKVPDSLR